MGQEVADKEGKILKKVFIFTYGEQVSAEQIDSVKTDFLALPALVDGMISAEWGKDTQNSQKHCLIMTFTDEDAHERYVNHPIHKGLGTKFGHLFEGFKMEGAYFWTEP
jgi:quinol monooxygenase YgiN